MSEASELKELARRLSRRIDHAAKHGQALADSIQAWTGEFESSLRPTIADDRLSWELRVGVHDPPLEEWGELFSDGIHVTRTILDHLAWGIAHLNRQIPERPKQVQFPIAGTRKEWRDEKRRIAELDPRARQAIEEIQPFQRAGQSPGPEADALLLLNELDNGAKHRLSWNPSLNAQEITHNFSVEFASEEIAAQEGAPQVEFDLDGLTASSVPALRQVTEHPIVRVKGEMHVQAQVMVTLDSGMSYGVTSVLSDLLTYVGIVSNHVLGKLAGTP